MSDNIQLELQARIEAFAADITSILQRAVANSVTHALGSTGVRQASKGAAAPKAKAVRELDPEVVLREVKRKGDRRMEELSKALRAPSKAIQPAIKALIAAKKVKTTGQARGTKYRAA